MASRQAVGALQAQATPPNARLYIDGSGSMAGFAEARGRTGSAFGDVIQSIGGSVGQLDIYRLGDAQPVPLGHANAARLAALQERDFYRCVGPEVGTNCTYQQSRTQTALQAIADGPADVLSIFVSDLWFSANEVRFDPAIQMRQALTQILRNRDILVYGFDSPYADVRSDLPSDRRDVRPPRTPFYMLVIGPSAQVRAFRTQFMQSGSAWISDRLTALPGSRLRSEVNVALFSRSASYRELPTLEFATNDQHHGFNPARPWREFLGAIPQQFKAEPEANSSLTWDAPAHMLDGAAWQGPLRNRLLAWQIYDPASCDRSQEARLLAEAVDGRMVLDPQMLRQRLGLGIWLIAGEVRRDQLDPNGPAIAWMNGWSFPGDPAGESAAIQRMTETSFMPTMNLANFGRLLQQAVSDASRSQSGEAAPYAGFATIIQIR